MKFVVRLFLLLTLIVSFLLETVGSAISFHKCIQTELVTCETEVADTDDCCCTGTEILSDAKAIGTAAQNTGINFQNSIDDCCKEISVYFNVPVYKVAQIFVPSTKIVDLQTFSIGSGFNAISFNQNSSFTIQQNKGIYQPPNEHLSVFCVFQI
jgi:hypothetical protein